MAKFDLEDWKKRRQRCRVDLRYLCGVLGYRDVSKAVHGRMYHHVQEFKGGEEPLKQVTVKTGAGYKPLCPMWELQGPRKRLNLVTRGGLKTTIITQAHSIQWLLNYPDIRILLVSAQLGRAKDFLKGIKEHFTKNDMFRWLFPEYCPKQNEQGKTEDFGNDEQFTIPCRRTPGIKEPTVRVASADSSVAGGHYDVIKVDDLVEDQNTRTPGGIEQTRKFFGSLWPLVETNPLPPGHGWLDVTGTIYHFSDLHQTIVSEESKKPDTEREWSILHIPAMASYPDGEAWWPARISKNHLQKIERDPALGPGVLFPQYLLKPLQDKDGLIKTKSDIRWISRKDLNNYAPRITWNVTIDCAGMEEVTGPDTDYSVVNLHGWGTDGRCYFDKIWWGRFSSDEMIDIFFVAFARRPDIQFFKCEKEAHSRMLAPGLRKEYAKRKIYLPFMLIPRDNKTSKRQRIRGSQPYWHNGAFIFCEDLGPTPIATNEVRNQLELEALYFPKFNHDDILDTCTDALQSRDGITSDVEGREKMLPTPAETDYREWKGIPVAAMSWEMLQGMTEEEYEGGLAGEFNPSASLFQ
jgi:hypothetical protein